MLNIKLNENNSITVDQDHGCRIEELKLGGKTVIKSNENPKHTSSGSYLMFPWVNRIVKNPYSQIAENQFNDGKGYPLHGLYANTKRQVKVQQQLQEHNPYVQINISNENKLPEIHGFTEVFTVGQNWFEIQLNVLESNQDPNPFCFGYHPYFQMSKPLSEIKISTNLDKWLLLEDDLLMRWPKELKQWNGILDGKQKYDTLFQGAEPYSENILGNFVELDDGVNKLRIQSNLEYWQIYTPPDGLRIAIQPMSFHGNVYEIYKQNPQIKDKLPKSGKIRVSIQ